MKTKIRAAILFAAISLTLISCNWFFGKKETVAKEQTILGRWKIENIADSSKQQKNGITLLAFAMSGKDSLPGVEFRPDSSFSLFNEQQSLDSGKYYLDTTNQTLFIKEEAGYMSLLIKTQTDSSLQLFSANDSVWYALKKQ